MEAEKERRLEELELGIVGLINQMRTVSDGLYKHTYDVDTPLSLINKGVIASVEKVLDQTREEFLVSERLSKFVEEKDPGTGLVLEYLAEEEQRKQELKTLAKNKSKYFSTFQKSMQQSIKKE
ncbi:hypothetical protein NECID01_0951 [Nematocida sp. AWRm77]|nr:hypothetical protein NECID01_0951 [Nematocida sp. AWRm77]